MKLFNLIILASITISINAQNKKTKQEIIAQIEELSNWSEVVFGNEMKYKLDMKYNPTTKRINIVNFADWGTRFNKTEISFYLSDIDKSSFSYNSSKIDKELYSTFVTISTNNKSVEWKKTEWKKGKKHLAITEEWYNDKINVAANSNLLSKYLSLRYIYLWYELTECTQKKQLK
ncbi:hypothetical protein [Seonamhaeicola marinus]|uniref:Uncharacterized protein n=1 Tax=Seonamhaeicola marinus TaxID=1912246 RepID=A0A5D0HIV1_9FLAO|nr:hypothetical protein [Seonamhaeicola marinus]TYA69987.1 hypothetical protein FUA24_22115 [Seonamhaeicola marinus]